MSTAKNPEPHPAAEAMRALVDALECLVDDIEPHGPMSARDVIDLGRQVILNAEFRACRPLGSA